eukprot:997069-Amphidinium_carterae.1
MQAMLPPPAPRAASSAGESDISSIACQIASDTEGSACAIARVPFLHGVPCVCAPRGKIAKQMAANMKTRAVQSGQLAPLEWEETAKDVRSKTGRKVSMNKFTAVLKEAHVWQTMFVQFICYLNFKVEQHDLMQIH